MLHSKQICKSLKQEKGRGKNRHQAYKCCPPPSPKGKTVKNAVIIKPCTVPHNASTYGNLLYCHWWLHNYLEKPETSNLL